jgi:DNA polymerase-3 subunit delta'
MPFKEIVNQDHIVNFLLASYHNDKVAGAYLFIGKEGIGKAKVAKEFAKLINCENANEDCCDLCVQCRKIDNNTHVDTHWIRDINNSITISQIRNLERYLYLKPYESKKKFFIICDAQYLTDESSNALLKSLEEPPKDSVIILIVDDTTTLLPTISSRCQKLVFNSLNETKIKDILIHKHNIPLSQAHFISYLAEGSLGKALNFKELKDSLFEKRNHILNAIYFRKFSLFRMEEFNIKDNTQKRNGLNLLLDILLTWFRDMLVVKADLEMPLINLDKKEDLSKLHNRYTYDELIKNITSIANTKSLINANINVKLAISKMRTDLWK